jgi:hypothetical protein
MKRVREFGHRHRPMFTTIANVTGLSAVLAPVTSGYLHLHFVLRAHTGPAPPGPCSRPLHFPRPHICARSVAPQQLRKWVPSSNTPDKTFAICFYMKYLKRLKHMKKHMKTLEKVIAKHIKHLDKTCNICVKHMQHTNKYTCNICLQSR